MSWVNILFAMAPENILLAGIIVLIGLEVAEADERSALAVSLIALVSACFVATWLAMNGYAFDAFPGHYSVDGSTLLAKAIVPVDDHAGCRSSAGSKVRRAGVPPAAGTT